MVKFHPFTPCVAVADKDSIWYGGLSGLAPWRLAVSPAGLGVRPRSVRPVLRWPWIYSWGPRNPPPPSARGASASPRPPNTHTPGMAIPVGARGAPRGLPASDLSFPSVSGTGRRGRSWITSTTETPGTRGSPPWSTSTARTAPCCSRPRVSGARVAGGPDGHGCGTPVMSPGKGGSSGQAAVIQGPGCL